MKRLRLVSTLCLPLAFAAAPVLAQTGQPAAKAPAGARSTAEREGSRLQMTIMEDAFQRAVEAVHARALESMQVQAGMPAVFTLDGNTRARAFRLQDYGVFFDVDLPPIPRSVEWTFRVLDTGAVLVPDIEQLKAQLDRLNDPRASRALDPIVNRMQAKVAAGTSMAGGSGEDAKGAGAQPRLVGDRAAEPADPFRGYVNELKQTLVQIMLQYGPTIQVTGDEWLTVAAREMSPRLMPGNPTEATITLRIKAGDLAALKAGRITPEEANKRIEITEVY